MRQFRSLLFACVASVVLYICIFGFVLARPLVVDEVGDLMNYKVSYAREAQGAKIFIIAGSTARFSHRCATLEELLGRFCINAGIAYGIGLDWVFEKFKPYMKPGDVVYMPLEYAQYSISRVQMLTGVDAAYRFRYDKIGLLARGPEGVIRAMFSFDLPVLINSVAEMALQLGGVHRRVGIETLDKQGDEVGHGDDEAGPYESFVSALPFAPPDSRRLLDNPQGQQKVIGAFLDWCRERGVVVVGGLPTMFNDRRIDDAIIQTLEEFYFRHGASFVELPNRSQYPRRSFFDTSLHLREGAQIAHSEMVANALRPFLRRR